MGGICRKRELLLVGQVSSFFLSNNGGFCSPLFYDVNFSLSISHIVVLLDV